MANETEMNMNEALIDYLVCEHFCLSYSRRFPSAVVTVKHLYKCLDLSEL